MMIVYESPAGILLCKLMDADKIDFKIIDRYLFKDNDEAVEILCDIKNHVLNEKMVAFLRKNIQEKTCLVVSDKILAKRLIEQQINAMDDFLLLRRLKMVIEEKNFEYFGLTKEEFENRRRYVANSIAIASLHVQTKEQDTIVIQTLKLYDDLEKDINMHSMRIKEWYGLHFPELSGLIENNASYLRAVYLIGNRENLFTMIESDYSDVFDVKQAQLLAKNSVGSDLADYDIMKIKEDIHCVQKMIKYRDDLLSYLTEKMKEVAPNLLELLGAIVGSRLIVKAGSLSALSKMPSSTIQILGAEKALFNALRQNEKTPKFGILFHAPLVSNSIYKGKMARILAAKTAIVSRVDYFKKNRDGKLGKKYYCLLDKKRHSMHSNNAAGVTIKKKIKSKTGA